MSFTELAQLCKTDKERAKAEILSMNDQDFGDWLEWLEWLCTERTKQLKRH